MRLKLLAFGLLVVGDLAWIVLPPLNADTWSEDLPVFGLWSAVAVLAWASPLLGALLLLVGAVFGTLFAFLIFFVVALSALGGKHSDVAPWLFWIFFLWWAVLPIASALLFITAHRKRRGLATW